MLCLARALLRQSATDNCGRDMLVDSAARCRHSHQKSLTNQLGDS